MFLIILIIAVLSLREYSKVTNYKPGSSKLQIGKHRIKTIGILTLPAPFPVAKQQEIPPNYDKSPPSITILNLDPGASIRHQTVLKTKTVLLLYNSTMKLHTVSFPNITISNKHLGPSENLVTERGEGLP